jgi:DNA-directed RNA polymerase specialized sigma24 family protein
LLYNKQIQFLSQFTQDEVFGGICMAKPSSHEVTDLLLAWRQGKQEALDKLVPIVYAEDPSIVTLDDAMIALAAEDERKSRVVELRFFGGLSVKETAEVLGVCVDTVMRDWKFAKTWLARQMNNPVAHRP